MGDFDCRTCQTDLRAEVGAALARSVPDFGFRPGRDGGGDYRIVEVVCPNDKVENSFKLRVGDG